MSYGLYDYDMTKYIHVPFNLELMKIASYYKSKREIVTLSPTYSPNMYKHFIIRKDYNDGIFDLSLTKHKNVEYGGMAFHPGLYVPLDIDIETSVPDTSIYYRMQKPFCSNKGLTSFFKTMMKANHLRFSLDGKTIWPSYEKQLNVTDSRTAIFIHDYDLGKVEGAQDLLRDLLKDFSTAGDGQRIGMKFPIQTYTDEELLDWASFKPMGRYFSVQFNGLLKAGTLKELMDITKGTSSMRQLTYDPTYGCDYDTFINERIFDVFHQASFLHTARIKIPLIYDKKFFRDERWARIIDLFNYYQGALLRMSKARAELKRGRDSLYNFACMLQDRNRCEDYMTQSEARELFQFVRENNYELFREFYEYRT